MDLHDAVASGYIMEGIVWKWDCMVIQWKYNIIAGKFRGSVARYPKEKKVFSTKFPPRYSLATCGLSAINLQKFYLISYRSIRKRFLPRKYASRYTATHR